MPQVYRCPGCKTNKSRFNMIQQVSVPVKKDPHTGEIVSEYSNDALDPFHLPYKGPELKVQCATCGMIDEEKSFAAFGNMDMQ
ncbi:DNA alkylation repair protein [Actinomycetes bacterium NPDC127524]|uniref:DNA alkylation repair protein n=1 Tax=unclassified Bacillus (in: firmicutes) TaxID=185979 RepID=UPI0008E968F9|nr:MULTISPECIES: DNA alkylation repair protein [unclassified Bacillus (in: firmicutes)]OIK09511.1 DNA alkylation repair protein [Bacillus sp. MUM 13]SFC77148.1 hypothetical protein SAMN05443252_10678 [Bacillus sp. OV322]